MYKDSVLFSKRRCKVGPKTGLKGRGVGRVRPKASIGAC